MNEQFLESAEFYNRRYHNFSSRVILPAFVLLLFLLSFAFLAKKELTISAGASIEPESILVNIQSTSNNAIIENHLEENKVVKKGQVLVKYKLEGEQAQQATLSSQLETLKEQKGQLELLKASLESGSSQFPAADKFGYEQNFQDYLNQAASLSANTEQQNATIASQNAAASNSQAELGNIINETNAKIADYRAVKSAIQTGASLDPTTSGYEIYQAYSAQVTDGSQEQLKSQYLAQVDGQISQLESALSGYRLQYAGSGAQQAYSGSLPSQLESLKAQNLARVGQEMTALEQKIMEVEGNSKIQAGLTQKGEILALEDGIIHLNPETKSSSLVPEGTLLAQLYPNLVENSKVKITSYISSKDISSIKEGDKVRFTTVDDANKQMSLTSTISSIDSSATKTEKGNFFKIEVKITLTKKEAATLRYGLEGRLVMITGQKTYFDYYKDKFLNQS
ncbi:bacteriocin secretion accessory protein [Streptococcus himalayensis]|uniref:Competence protein ComB n=1 Tax=Streptococcus himalayensis TaxID=1888195 RepID=A0A917AAP6_9STRE|nr:bacteriocin secretion accessory protein [Streptococcus himalayensis]GGE37101.1 competence protein ComB [Streptococcus himalayensis]